MTILVRAGIPLPSGALVDHARAKGMPILMSANAFARRYPRGHPREGFFKSFRTDLSHLQGLDCVLDSGGYVAMARYNGYSYEIADYIGLVASHCWTHSFAMDFCVEPELASDAPLRRLRLAATAVNYARCVRTAARFKVTAPLPVVQGWELAEYLQCIDWMPVFEWPNLIGVGSMCRRNVHGPDGVLEIVAALDRVLPPTTQLHLFGVKSAAIGLLNTLDCQQARPGKPPRVFSADSCAWDYAARAENRTGRTMERRIEHLDRWMARQEYAQRVKAPIRARTAEQPTALGTLVATIREISADRLAAMLLDEDIEYQDAVISLERSDCWARAYAHQHKLSPESDRAKIEEFLADACL